jgi:hypothetical protein
VPISKRGIRYAQGSHSVWSADAWETRRCHVCGGRVTVAESAFHSRYGLDGQPVSVHFGCGGLRSLRADA